MTGDEFVRWMETWPDGERWELHDGHAVLLRGAEGATVDAAMIDMPAIAEKPDMRMTGDEFERWSQTWADGERWELLDGYPVAMAGGTAAHDTIAVNLTVALAALRNKGCRPHRDVMLRSTANSDFGAYPDVYVRCGPPADQRTSLNDPVAVFEVLSDSTMQTDRGIKMSQYMKMPTLQHACLIYQTEFRIELWSRDAAGEWILKPTILRQLDDTLHLAAFDLSIPLRDIYADTELVAAAS